VGVSGGRQGWRARPFPFASTCMLLTVDMQVCEVQKALSSSAQMYNGNPFRCIQCSGSRDIGRAKMPGKTGINSRNTSLTCMLIISA